MDHLYSSDLVTAKYNCLFQISTTLIHLLSISSEELPLPSIAITTLDGGYFAVFINCAVFHAFESLLSRCFIPNRLLLFSLKSILVEDYSWQSRFFVQMSQLFEETLVHMLELELCLEIATLRHLDDYSYHHRLKNLLTKSRSIT